VSEFDLTDIKSLVASGAVWFTKSCRDAIVAYFGCPVADAPSKFEAILGGLSDKHWSETLTQQYGQKFDVYGCYAEGCGWYIKMGIEPDLKGNDEVIVLSCHAPVKPITTKQGVVK
jgi:hypothetical protein